MELINLEIGRVVIHEVFQRADDRTKIEPKFGEAIEVLDVEATDALRNRIVAAVASPSRCIQMSIEKFGAGSMNAVAKGLIDADDAMFIQLSKSVADLLADAQKYRTIPGGIVVVFTGRAGVPAKRLVGVIKADVYSGFTREEQEGVLALKYLKSLLLTAQTKLYKIGLFIETTPSTEPLPAGWDAFIYDETLTLANRYGAAQYFYDGFLGCVFPQSSARQTKQFHDLTKNFIRSMAVPEEDKVTLHNALVTYLKADQSPTVSVASFGQTYLQEPEIREAYSQFMTESAFPNTAVNKDLADVNSSLRFRRLTFRNQIKVTGPAEGFEDLMTVEVIDGTPAGPNGAPRWTRLTVKDCIADQT